MGRIQQIKAPPRALVLGATGQTGSYMCDWLLHQGYEVYILVRRTSGNNLSRISHCLKDLRPLTADLGDQGSLEQALEASFPHEVYNFAAQSFVGSSYSQPLYTMDVSAVGAVRLLEAIRNVVPWTKLYHASSSEMFGNAAMSPQTELTPFNPVSPYAIAKVAAHHFMSMYRKAYGMFIACGIAYNHESERRGEEFVTRKITKAVAAIKAGKQAELVLGDCTTKRDWSHAEDIVRGAWLMLQQDEPQDYVLASGESHSVQEFVEAAFNVASLDWSQYVRIDRTLYRPTEVHHLQGHAEKARTLLGWKPTISFGELVNRMVTHDLELACPTR